MYKVLAIDPGNVQSGFVLWDGRRILKYGKYMNADIKRFIQVQAGVNVAIEMIASYGMPVGKSIFETVLFIGQVQQLCYNVKDECTLIYRQEVKLHFCRSVRAKDAHIRQALIDRFGEKGTKHAPGITYGLSADVWQAFAVAVYYSDTKQKEPVMSR